MTPFLLSVLPSTRLTLCLFNVIVFRAVSTFKNTVFFCFSFSPLLHLFRHLPLFRPNSSPFLLPPPLHEKITHKHPQRYKDRIRAELNKHLRTEFEKRTSNELNQAVPPTETLNSEPAKEKAGLARQGSLAERQPPASLVQKRTQLTNHNTDVPMMEDDVSLT